MTEKADKSTELKHPELRSLFALWLKQCPDGGVPLSCDMEPADLRRWLGNILIMDAVGGGEFAYSYYGRNLARAFGESRQGQTLDHLPDDQAAILRSEYDLVRRTRAPVHRIHAADFSGVRRTWERVVLPLSSDGEVIDKLLVAAYEL